MMCQGCDDFTEYDRAADAFLSAELLKSIATPIDWAIINGLDA